MQDEWTRASFLKQLLTTFLPAFVQLSNSNIGVSTESFCFSFLLPIKHLLYSAYDFELRNIFHFYDLFFFCLLSTPPLSLYYFLDYPSRASKMSSSAYSTHNSISHRATKKATWKHSVGQLFKIHSIASHQILNNFLKLAFKVPFHMYWVEQNKLWLCSSKRVEY